MGLKSKEIYPLTTRQLKLTAIETRLKPLLSLFYSLANDIELKQTAIETRLKLLQKQLNF